MKPQESEAAAAAAAAGRWPQIIGWHRESGRGRRTRGAGRGGWADGLSQAVRETPQHLTHQHLFPVHTASPRLHLSIPHGVCEVETTHTHTQTPKTNKAEDGEFFFLHIFHIP